MIFYSCIFNISLISILFYWKIAVPMLLVALTPIGLNVWWLLTSDEKRRSVLDKNKSSWTLTVFYTLMGLIAATTFGFSMLFLMSIITFNYSYELYFPSIGWGFLNLFLSIASLVTSIYSLSFVKLVYDQRKFFN